MTEKDYVIRVLDSPLEVAASDWNTLLALQSVGEATSPFMRHEYLAAMHESGSATPKTGWTPRFITLWHGQALAGACALYLKTHSHGEYVFDWAWANAYAEHGLAYYPKALIAPPFTPVPGARLLARNAAERTLLMKAVVGWCAQEKLSSLHLLFASDEDVAACEEAGLMLRHNVQFHWTNVANVAPTLVASRTTLPPEGAGLASETRPALRRAAVTSDAGVSQDPTSVAVRAEPVEASPANTNPSTSSGLTGSRAGYRDFDDFLMSLSQEKRKKIRQERRKVAEAGITFRWSLGTDISDADWDFFYQCYERTYYEHGNAPYLSRDFFRRMQRTMPENWLLFVGEHLGKDGVRQNIATSLIAVSTTIEAPTLVASHTTLPPEGYSDRPELVEGWGGPSLHSCPAADAGNSERAQASARIAYGRYWGAVARVDCLHFEACYYQPLQWCIEQGYQRFEGGAQGEHKMARALLPVKTTSAHWLAHPSFADAVERFLEREGAGIERYMDELEKRSPLKQASLDKPIDSLSNK